MHLTIARVTGSLGQHARSAPVTSPRRFTAASQTLDDRVHAYLTLTPEQAFEQADQR